MKKYLYVRVSTKEQNESRQLALATKYDIRKSDIFIDKATGRNLDRPAYQALKEDLRSGDILIVDSIDRLSRNKQQAMKELSYFKENKIKVVIEEIPTTHMLLNGDCNDAILDMINNIIIEVYATFAHIEYDKITRRRTEGINAMPINPLTGKKMSSKTGQDTGRPKVLNNISPENLKLIKLWIKKELKLADLKALTGISERTLYRIKKEIGV